MSRETPQAVFEHARAAMLRGDLFEVFACLDVNDLKRVAANAVALSLGARIDDANDEVRRICDGHGFPLDDLLSARQGVMQMPGIEATTKHMFTWMIHIFPYEPDFKEVFSMNDDVAHVH